MSSKKPIIFIKPFSKSVSKLKIILEEILLTEKPSENDMANGITSEEKNFEIFEVETGEEAAQLLQALGPSLTIITSPKRCALMLKLTSGYIKQFKSKVLLITPKKINPAILNKLSKVGLTEYIQEPINPKTVLYKIKLLLKSIQLFEEIKNSKKDEDKIVIKKAKDEQLTSMQEAQKVEKRLLDSDKQKEESDEIKKVASFDLNLSSDLINNTDINDEHYPENEDKNEELQVKKNSELDIDKNAGQEKKPAHDHINYSRLDTYYKTSRKTDNIEIEIEKIKKNNLSTFEEENDPLFLKEKQEIDLEIQAMRDRGYSDEELSKPKKKKQQIEISLEKAKKKDGHNFSEEQDQADLYGKNKKTNLKLEKTNKSFDDIFSEEEDTELSNAKKRLQNIDLNLEDSEDESPSIKEDNKSKHNKNKHKIIDLNLQKPKKQLEENQDDENDDYLKTKSKDSIEIEIDQSKNKKKQHETIDLDLKDSPKDTDIYNEQNENDDQDKKTPQKHIKIELEDTKTNNQSNDSQSKKKYDLQKGQNLPDKDQNEKPKKTETILNIKKQRKDLNETKNNDSESKNIDKNNSIDLNLEKETKDDKLPRKDNESDNMKSKGLKNTNLDLKAEGNIKNHGVNHINTYYGLKKRNKTERGEDWDNLHKKDNVIDISIAKKKKQATIDININFSKGDDLSIDYSKLKKEFEIVGLIERRKKQSMHDSKINLEDDPEYLEMLKKLKDIESRTKKISKSKEEQEIEDNKDIIIADSKAIEHVVAIYSMYENKKINTNDIFDYCSQVIFKQFKGITNFFIYQDKSKTFTESYLGHKYLNILEDMETLEEQWIDIKKGKFEIWKEAKLPTWSDLTFENESTYFIYPYFEGDQIMGFSTVSFSSKFDENNCRKVELLLESMRGIFLEQTHLTGGKGSYQKTSNADTHTLIQKKQSKIKIGSFFKRKKVINE